VVLMIDRDLCLGRACMQPLNPGPGDSRGQEYQGQCHGSAAAQPREHTGEDKTQGALAGDRISHQTWRPADRVWADGPGLLDA
jgi:hypothetical protein